MRAALWTAAVLAVLACTPAALADEIDALVRSTMERERIPGAMLGIARGGTQHVRTYGLSNLEHLAAVRPDTVFQSGSTGKPFTAAAVLMLFEEGRLEIDAPLAEYFATAPPHWRRMRVRHLLTHTSGLPDDGEGNGFIDLRRDYTEDELAQLAMKLPLEFEPGTQWSYSNTGYVVLGILVHKVSGRFYGDFLRERVFERLDMVTARVISESDIVPDRAAGYVRTAKGVRNQDWVSPSLNTTAGGSLYLSARDYLKWMEGLRGGRVLRPATLKLAWTPVRLQDGATYPYGFGWMLGEQRGFRTVEHQGAWQGFKASIAHYPEADLTVVLVCNLDKCDAGGLSHRIAGLVDPLLALPDPRGSPNDPRPSRTLALREMLEAWIREEPHALMAQRLREHPDLSAGARLTREHVAGWLSASTAFRFIGEDDVQGRGIERQGGNVARIVHIGLPSREAAPALRFYLNGDGQVLHVALDGP